MSHLDTKFVIIPDWPFFGCILYNVFGEGSNSAIVSGRLANLIMISEEHWKNDEILFQNVYGHRESVKNYGIHLTDKGHANLGLLLV